MEEKIYLRALELEDYLTSVKWRNDDNIWEKLGGTKYFVSSAYEKQWVEHAIKDTNSIRLAICVKETNEYIGNVYITNINMTNRSGVSHIFIGNRAYWGGGYGTEAYNLLLAYAFNERGFHRIEAHVLEDNEASIKLHLKLGYHKEGLLREAVFKNGCFKNQFIFSVLDSEWNNFNSK